MTRTEQVEFFGCVAGRRRRICCKAWAHTGKLIGKVCNRLVRVNLGENCRAQEQRVRLRSDCARHRYQDSMNLTLLLVQQTCQLVIMLDGLHWFNEDGLAAR